ncbi:hypothetical protein [Rathayibacter sp. VKM Ac-2760]|uniref:hypothetical protein n=1 Tax=Rathayibacter sp. VKM Ac-2760 TaxID=2609253 RepID=UPI001318E96B|nr:hypothetical protein [Rathayibacter sp. VKM Ac-2760]QHC61189.1 hypothetical protein GSU72_20925 [Rathayibacter sp. VKM Ac-2760]
MTPSLTTAADLSTFPTTERILGWIEHLTALGHRKTGTPQGRASAEFIAGALRSFGLDDVTIETAPTPCPTVHDLPVTHQPGAEEIPYVFRPDEVVSDAYYFAEAGIPAVSLVAAQIYLFHPSDTIDRVPIDQLRPVGLAFAKIAVAAAGRLR